MKDYAKLKKVYFYVLFVLNPVFMLMPFFRKNIIYLHKIYSNLSDRRDTEFKKIKSEKTQITFTSRINVSLHNLCHTIYAYCVSFAIKLEGVVYSSSINYNHADNEKFSIFVRKTERVLLRQKINTSASSRIWMQILRLAKVK